jgi:hypothetical protein
MKTSMKFLYLLTIATLLIALPVPLHSQNRKVDKEITIHANEIAVESLLQILIKNTGMQFSYNPHTINNAPKLSISKHTLTAAGWLNMLKAATKIDYKIVGDHIILTGNKKHVVTRRETGKPVPKSKTKRDDNTLHATAKLDAREKPQELFTDTTTHLTTTPTLHNDDKNFQDTVQLNVNMYSDTSLRVTADTTTRKITTTTAPEVIARDVHQDERNLATTARQKNTALLQNFTRFDIGAQGIGIGIERKLATRLLADIGAGIGARYVLTPGNLKYRLSIHEPGAYASITTRWYYNGTKNKIEDGQSTGNAGNYIGARIKYVHDLSKIQDYGSVMLFNIHWGIQRRLANRILINAHIGPGYAIPTHSDTYSGNAFYPSIDLKLSYLFGSLRK